VVGGGAGMVRQFQFLAEAARFSWSSQTGFPPVESQGLKTCGKMCERFTFLRECFRRFAEGGEEGEGGR